MSKRDFYEVLGIARTASDDEIKKAYRTLAMKYHPDRNQGDKASEEKFKEVKEAYETLSNPELRNSYDQHGHDKPHQHANTNSWSFNQQPGSDFHDIFSELFRHHTFNEGIFAQQQNRQRVEIINISLADAYTGKTARLDATRNINIPAGVRSGTRFSVDNKFFRIDIQPHTKFKRSNDDLLVDIEITAIEAMLGLVALLEHLDCAKLQFTIPAGIQSGQIVRLSNKGMRNPETDKFGDVLVRVSITIPKVLSEKEKEALKALNHRDIIDI